ncbi:MAG: DUF4199 domain-containing protein [Bacteroidota bacterium]
MDNINKHLWKNSIYVGAITGGSLVFISFLAYLTDSAFFKFIEGMQMPLLIVAIILGTKYLRDKVLDGAITYGKAVGSGVLISLFTGLLLALYGYILRTSLDPQLLEQELTALEEVYLNWGFTEDQVELMVQQYKSIFSPVTFSVVGTLSTGFMGLIISLIAAIFLKREADPFADISSESNNELPEEKA